jgi:hypothetical protein
MDPEVTPLGDAAEQRMAEEADLRESLESLSRLSTSNLELEGLLKRVATYAVQAIPGADGAGSPCSSRTGPTPWWPRRHS